jgi:peptide/nickel transport system permease protein
MARNFLSRSGWAALTLFAVLSFVFLIARLTGDPVRLMLPDQASDADVQAMRDPLGLNRPAIEQYAAFVWGAVHGDLGNSIRHSRPAIDLILERLPATLELALMSFAAGFSLALLLAPALYTDRRWTALSGPPPSGDTVSAAVFVARKVPAM